MENSNGFKKYDAQAAKDNVIKDVCKGISDEAVAVIRATFKSAAMRKEGKNDIAMQFEEIRLNAAANVQKLVVTLSALLTESGGEV